MVVIAGPRFCWLLDTVGGRAPSVGESSRKLVAYSFAYALQFMLPLHCILPCGIKGFSRMLHAGAGGGWRWTALNCGGSEISEICRPTIEETTPLRANAQKNDVDYFIVENFRRWTSAVGFISMRRLVDILFCSCPRSGRVENPLFRAFRRTYINSCRQHSLVTKSTTCWCLFYLVEMSCNI